MESAKRVNIVSVKLVKEASILYKNRRIRSLQDSYELFRDYLGDVDREHFVVVCNERNVVDQNLKKHTENRSCL